MQFELEQNRMASVIAASTMCLGNEIRAVRGLQKRMCADIKKLFEQLLLS